MQNSEYLPVGHQIGGLYEIVKVLGRDDFEIVYLIKDLHRMDSLVLKELFLKGSSFRDKANIYTQEKLKKAFQETKEGIIKEVTLLKGLKKANRLQTYGYFEENNTIYTIMEYREKAPLESYLKIIPQPTVEPAPAKPKKQKVDNQKPQKSYLFLKLLIVLIFIATLLGAYAYKIMVYDREKAKEIPKVVVTQTPKPIYHPPLVDRDKTTKEIPKPKIEEREIEESQKEETVIADNNFPLNLPNDEIEIQTDIDNDVEPKTAQDLPQTNTEEQESKEEVSINVEKEPTVEPALRVEATNPSHISLGTKIGGTAPHTSTSTFTREKIQSFLENFIASGERGSVAEIVNHYDTKVDKYFSLNHVTHQTIYNDKRRYNKRWSKRNFQLLDFKIVKIYYKNTIEYCDIKSRTKWKVSNQASKTVSGISNVFMTIKKTPYGFRVKSIYSF